MRTVLELQQHSFAYSDGPVRARVELVVNVTKAVVVLNNYLMPGRSFTESSKYCPIGFVDSDVPTGTQMGEWRELACGDLGIRPITRVGSNKYSRSAKHVHEDFGDYFMSIPRQVPWQWYSTYSAEDAFENDRE